MNWIEFQLLRFFFQVRVLTINNFNLIFAARLSNAVGNHSKQNDEDIDVEQVEESNEEKHKSSSSPASPKAAMMPKKRKDEKNPRIRNKCNSDELRYIECILETKDLWDKFHDYETEMIITKTGR